MTRQPRPAEVTAAVVLLAAEAAFQVANAIASAITAGPVIRVYQRYAIDEVGARHAWIVDNNYTGIIWQAGVLAVAFSVLAIFLLRGSNIARVLTWVLCIPVLGLNLLGFTGGTSTPLGSNGNLSSPTTELALAVAQEAPAWAAPYAVAEGVISIALLISVIILLLRPPARRYTLGLR
ncbi:hypothetical protein Rhe02_74580 [Rhizocola hellebori]|uniref:Uncharacterized protein n=1 Tax=Rhizocola hellebori TaxID=1392758 RepID=A0A8J3QER5_9ACTN|nr:hypothetical protein [Rhizocola hellebori]GIH09391.1 hypothetical protein Rhe02_74580 [Rhizocola hellebori]